MFTVFLITVYKCANVVACEFLEYNMLYEEHRDTMNIQYHVK